jgi:DNA recombination protein RmuC
VVIVCPSTLFATLRTIASQWNIEQQNRNVKEIARQAGGLYDKFAGLLDDLQKVGRQMSLLQTSYDAAMNKLSTGSGNLISRVENLKILGAKTSKSLPKELLEIDAIENADAS